MEIDLPLLARLQISVLAIFFAALALSTVLLHLRTRSRPTLVMLIAVVIGWFSVGLGWFGPRETVTTRIPAASVDRSADALSDQPQARISGVSTQTSSVFPVTWLIFGSLLVWAGGFLVHAMLADKKR